MRGSHCVTVSLCQHMAAFVMQSTVTLLIFTRAFVGRSLVLVIMVWGKVFSLLECTQNLFFTTYTKQPNPVKTLTKSRELVGRPQRQEGEQPKEEYMYIYIPPIQTTTHPTQTRPCLINLSLQQAAPPHTHPQSSPPICICHLSCTSAPRFTTSLLTGRRYVDIQWAVKERYKKKERKEKRSRDESWEFSTLCPQHLCWWVLLSWHQSGIYSKSAETHHLSGQQQR